MTYWILAALVFVYLWIIERRITRLENEIHDLMTGQTEPLFPAGEWGGGVRHPVRTRSRWFKDD